MENAKNVKKSIFDRFFTFLHFLRFGPPDGVKTSILRVQKTIDFDPPKLTFSTPKFHPLSALYLSQRRLFASSFVFEGGFNEALIRWPVKTVFFHPSKWGFKNHYLERRFWPQTGISRFRQKSVKIAILAVFCFSGLEEESPWASGLRLRLQNDHVSSGCFRSAVRRR